MANRTDDELSRIKEEISDSFDEELELQMEEDRLDELVAEGMSPSGEKTLDRKIYFRELFRLQHELVRLQDWVQHKKLKVVVLFEGAIPPARAAPSSASPSGSIRGSAAPSPCPPRPSGSAANGISSAMSRICRPAAKWCCSTAAGTTAPASSAVMGFCTPDELEEFFRSVPEFEHMLVRSGIVLLKYWFSITDEEQEFRFRMRIEDPLKQWKLSPMDLESRVHWEDYTKAKEEMLARTHTDVAPVVGGAGGRQEAGAAQLHRASAGADPL